MILHDSLWHQPIFTTVSLIGPCHIMYSNWIFVMRDGLMHMPHLLFCTHMNSCLAIIFSVRLHHIVDYLTAVILATVIRMICIGRTKAGLIFVVVTYSQLHILWGCSIIPRIKQCVILYPYKIKNTCTQYPGFDFSGDVK